MSTVIREMTSQDAIKLKNTVYKEYFHKFVVGEILHNDNDGEYRVVEVSSQNQVLFENVSDGEKVVAIRPRMYHKTYKGNTVDVLIWDMGKYIGDKRAFR